MRAATFALGEEALLLGQALLRIADAVRILESGAKDAEVRERALTVLREGSRD